VLLTLASGWMYTTLGRSVPWQSLGKSHGVSITGYLVFLMPGSSGFLAQGRGNGAEEDV